MITWAVLFKENCPDIRNSRVIDIVRELEEFGVNVETYDPWADPKEVKKEYGIDLISKEHLRNNGYYDAVVLAVSHNNFLELDYQLLKNNQTIIYDVKGMLPKDIVDERL